MDPMLAEFAAVAGTLTYHEPTMRLVTTASGAITSPDHWVRHVRETVPFADAVRTLAAAGVTRFVELGPDAALSGMTAECVSGVEDVLVVPSARRNRPEPAMLLTALAQLHVRGARV